MCKIYYLLQLTTYIFYVTIYSSEKYKIQDFKSHYLEVVYKYVSYDRMKGIKPALNFILRNLIISAEEIRVIF